MTADSSTLQPISHSSQLIESSGASDVVAVAWSVVAKYAQDHMAYEVASPGGFTLSLTGSSAFGLRGEQLPVALGACTIIVESDSVAISGSNGTMPQRTRRILVGELLDGSPNSSSSVTFRPLEATKYYYKVTSSGEESWTVVADIALLLDQPRTVNNDRVRIECENGGDFPWSTLTWYHDPASNDMLLNIHAINTTWRDRDAAFALKNLLVKADVPSFIDVTGKYEGGAFVSGAVSLVSRLRYTLPFLPDPYATNLELMPDPAVEKNGMGYLTVLQRWIQDTVEQLDVSIMTGTAIPARTLERNANDNLDDPALGRIRDGSAPYWGEDASFHFRELTSGIIPDIGIGQLVHSPDGELDSRILHPPTLLDLSTNSSQFGVVFGGGTGLTLPETSRPWPFPIFAPTEEFGISQLMLESAVSNVRIMTLPAVHWEPVLEGTPLEGAASHQLYSFPYSGPSTQIAIQDGIEPVPSVRLVPVAPQEAIEGLSGSFNSPSATTVAVRTSLPFGIVALASMNNQWAGLQYPAQVSKVEFTVGGEEDPKTNPKKPQLQPAHQISFKPPRRMPVDRLRPTESDSEHLKLVGSEDAYFPGRTILLAMGVGPNGTDLLDPATKTFNGEMNERVPLLRFDVSGYGASIFSDWKRVPVLKDPPSPSGEQRDITHVLMNVLNGRTSREVIELQAWKAPCAVPLTKTIEIRRLNSGVVLRREGQWEKTGNGFYYYPNPDIISHPGIIRGVTDVRNITEIGGTFKVKGVPWDLRRVKYDCNIQIEDKGEVRGVPGLALDGCVIMKGSDGDQPLRDLSDPEAPKWYAEMLEQLSLGGQIDTIVQIGNSGQQERITSMMFKPAPDPELGRVAVGAGMGTLIFPGGGQWSVAQIQRGDQSKQPHLVDMAKGIPLVKIGRHDDPSLGMLTTDYLFRDPQDLLNPNPTSMYSIIHGATSHRVLFKSPEIPFAQDLEKRFQAAEVWVADSLSLGKSASIFPSLLDCLKVQTESGSTQVLEIVEGAGYRFEPTRIINGRVVPLLDLPDDVNVERIIKSDASIQTVAQVMKEATIIRDGVNDLAPDVLAAKTTLSVAINTVENISKMDVTNIHMVTRTVKDLEQKAKDASRVVGRLSSDMKKVGGLLGVDPDLDLPDDLGLPKVAQDVAHHFGSALDKVQKAISFLENLKFLPHFKVSMTNEWAMVMSTSMNKADLLDKMDPATATAVGRIIETFDFLINTALSLASFLLKMHIGVTIKIPTGVGPIVALGTGAFDVALGTSGVQVSLDLGFGIGVDFSVGPFSASASYTQSQRIIVSDDVFGLGITACMRAHVDLVIASADLYLEAKLLVVGGECHPEDVHRAHGGTTIWAYARVKIAIHVSIFLVCNIGFEEEAHWDSNLNGGHCALDDMTDLVPH